MILKSWTIVERVKRDKHAAERASITSGCCRFLCHFILLFGLRWSGAFSTVMR